MAEMVGPDRRGGQSEYSGTVICDRKQLRVAISLDPHFLASHHYLIRIYQSYGVCEEAFQEFLKP